MRELGLEIVETCVPWAVHERRPGAYDFASGSLALGEFLDRAAALGLRAIVRPGPHIHAELTELGFPARVVRDEAMQARTARGTPAFLPMPPRMFPLPSYASRAFRAAATDWLRAVGDVIGPRRWPDGPVVAAQVDHETQSFFRTGAFDLDYHPDALSWWDDWTGGRGIEPPRRWDPAAAPTCLRWVAFRDEYTARSLAWVAAAMREAGFGGLALLHNLPPTEPEMAHLLAAERAIEGPGGVAVGMDFFHARRGYSVWRRRALYLAGTASVLPCAPEVGLGGPPWLPPMTPADQEEVTRGLLMCGLRAMNLFMVVERDRWYGAPIGRDGRARARPAAFVARLLEGMRRLDWTELRRRTPVALVATRAYARLSIASSLGDPLPHMVLDWLRPGPAGSAELSREPIARQHRLLANRWEAALDRAAVPYVIVDEDVAEERLSRFAAVVTPTLKRVDRALWRKLKSLATRGVKVVVGPEAPALDEWGVALGEDAGAPPGVLVAADEEALLREIGGFREETPRAWIRSGDGGDGRVDTAVFEDASGIARVLFVANPSGTRIVAELMAGVAATDTFTGERVTDARLALGPYQVAMLELG